MTGAPAPLTVRDIDTPGTDPVVRAASQVIGGPLGRYARVGATLPWRPAAVVLSLVGTVMVVAGTIQKGYCTANGWAEPDVFWRACYSDLPFLFSGSALATGEFPYGSTADLAQPVVTGITMWLSALLVPGGDDVVVRERWYFAIWALLTVVVIALLVRVTARSCRRDPWRAAHVAASPLLVTVALVAPDLVGVLLASYALWWWSRGRTTWAGLAFGLAIAARTYPVLLLLVIGLLAIRAGRWRAWAQSAGVALLTWAALLLAIGLPTRGGSFAPYEAWWRAGPDYGSPWYLPALADVSVLPVVAALLAMSGWLIALGAGAMVAWSAPRRPTIGEVGLIVVGIVLITGKALPVQSSLWLLPLIALAGLRWRDHLIWATTEVLYFVMIWLYLGGLSDPNRGLPLGWLALFSVLRIGGICWLVAAAWRSAMARPPAPDAAPASEGDDGFAASQEPDEVAGPLAGAPDQVVVRFR